MGSQKKADPIPKGKIKAVVRYVSHLPLWVGVAVLAAWKIFWVLHEMRAKSVTNFAITRTSSTEKLKNEQDQLDAASADAIHNYERIRDDALRGGNQGGGPGPSGTA